MATYFNDCSSVTGWSERIKTGRGWASSGGSIEIVAAGATDWNYLTLDEVEDSNHANVEILAKYTTPSSLSSARYPLVVRGAGSDESATGYSVRVSSSSIRIYSCNASDTPVQVATAAFTFNTSTTYWIRFRANSTSLKARVWADGGGEPGTWNIDVTDGTISAAGWNGLSDYSTTVNGGTVDQIGFGTNGDTAPASAGGGATITGSGTPTAQSSTVAGTAERSVTGTGTPTAQASAVAGVAERVITSSGTPTAQSSTVSGTGTVGGAFTGSGTLQAQSATVSGTAERSVTGTGAPASQAATVSGVAERVVTGTGTPTSQSSTVSGTGQVGNVVTGSGSPTAQAATVSGTAERTVTSSGALSAQSSTVAGTAERTITGSGALSAQSSTVYGFDSTPVDTGVRRIYPAGGARIDREINEWFQKNEDTAHAKRLMREDEELVLILLALAA